MAVCEQCDRDYYDFNDIGDGLCPTCADAKEQMSDAAGDFLAGMEERIQVPHFTVHPANPNVPDGEYVLRVHHPAGHLCGLGLINAKDEAERICKTLNECVRNDSLEADRWIDYFRG